MAPNLATPQISFAKRRKRRKGGEERGKRRGRGALLLLFLLLILLLLLLLLFPFPLLLKGACHFKYWIPKKRGFIKIIPRLILGCFDQADFRNRLIFKVTGPL